MLELVTVSKIYDEGHPTVALQPTDLRIGRHDYVTISGHSGSGKSTLLNLLGLLDTPSSGVYLIDGADSTGIGEEQRCSVRGQLFGFVFQAFHLLPGRSAVENVELGMLYGSVPARRRRERATAALELVQVAHRANADPRHLSGGERQRVAVARAIAGNAQVLFCDEPTGNLDSENTDNILNLLQQLHEGGLTVVVVTHDPEVAARGHRRLVVRDGVVSEQ